jgi:hypothetical protein
VGPARARCKVPRRASRLNPFLGARRAIQAACPLQRRRSPPPGSLPAAWSAALQFPLELNTGLAAASIRAPGARPAHVRGAGFS